MNEILKPDFSNAKIGDRVKNNRGLRGSIFQNDKNNTHGVKGIEINLHPISILFDGDLHPTCLTYDGKYNSSDKYPSVFYDYEGQWPTIEARVRPLPKIEVNEKVYIWIERTKSFSTAHFAEFNKSGFLCVFQCGTSEFTNCSSSYFCVKYWKLASDETINSGNLHEIDELKGVKK